MKYIIVDLEATCWEKKSPTDVNEIIEIGAVCVDEHKNIQSEFCAFIKPTLNPKLSEFCKSLTTITQENVDAAETFDVTLQKFKNWVNTQDEYILCSWGFYDKQQFESDCRLHQLNTDWLKHHISLKHQYAVIKNIKRPIGMMGALKMENMVAEGTHHRGIDDARNICRLFLTYFDNWKV
ncbi:MAG: exonuclease domain-containing protein [Bacteroidia bacterium]|nr:exonuclease domain-containing protein [Bacteroidia bacterium]